MYNGIYRLITYTYQIRKTSNLIEITWHTRPMNYFGCNLSMKYTLCYSALILRWN